MKKNKILLLLMALGLLAGNLYAQEESNTIEKTIALDNSAASTLLVKNINGAVSVEGYDGNTIQLVVERTISAKNKERLQEGLADVQLGIKEDGNTVVVYIEAPFATLKKGNSGRWHYNVNHDNVRYEYTFDMKLRVPENIKLEASSVNGGTVSVENFKGDVEAHNVNGGVSLSNVSGSSSAGTVNGAIQAELNSLPGEAVAYTTVNGDIKVFYPEQLAADVSFETLNGDFYTDFEEVSQRPGEVEKAGNGKKVVYRIDKGAELSVNGGGSPLKFKTINGDVYLQKKE